jgi:hypothetical protein
LGCRTRKPHFPCFFEGFEARVSRVSSKRVALGELRILARKEPVNQLTQKAGSECSRLFALNPWISKGLRRFCDRGARFSSEPVALGVRKQPWRLGSNPGSNPFELSDSLVNKRYYLTTRLLSNPDKKLRKADRRVNARGQRPPWMKSTRANATCYNLNPSITREALCCSGNVGLEPTIS